MYVYTVVVFYHGASWKFDRCSHIREKFSGFVNCLGISCLTNEPLYRNIGLDLINHTFMWFQGQLKWKPDCSWWHTPGRKTSFGWIGCGKIMRFYMRKPWRDWGEIFCHCWYIHKCVYMFYTEELGLNLSTFLGTNSNLSTVWKTVFEYVLRFVVKFWDHTDHTFCQHYMILLTFFCNVSYSRLC